MTPDDAPLLIEYADVRDVPDILRGKTRLTDDGRLLLFVDDLTVEERSVFWHSVIASARAGKTPHLQRGTDS